MRWLQLALIGAGSLLLVVCGACYLEAIAFQALAGGFPNSFAVLPAAAVVAQEFSTGRIEISRIGLEAAIREGTDAHTLLIAVGHVPGTAVPGEEGNVVLTGHRDSFFRGLRNIRQGDAVALTWRSDRYEYAVESTEVVSPSQTEVMDPAEGRVLTLITCYPFTYIGPAPKRFVVRARQIGPALPEPARDGGEL